MKKLLSILLTMALTSLISEVNSQENQLRIFQEMELYFGTIYPTIMVESHNEGYTRNNPKYRDVKVSIEIQGKKITTIVGGSVNLDCNNGQYVPKNISTMEQILIFFKKRDFKRVKEILHNVEQNCQYGGVMEYQLKRKRTYDLLKKSYAAKAPERNLKNAILNYGLSSNLSPAVKSIAGHTEFTKSFFVKNMVLNRTVKIDITGDFEELKIPLFVDDTIKIFEVGEEIGRDVKKEVTYDLGSLITKSSFSAKEKTLFETAFIFSLTEEGLQRAAFLCRKEGYKAFLISFRIQNEKDILEYSFSKSDAVGSFTLKNNSKGKLGGGVFGVFPIVIGGGGGTFTSSQNGQGQYESSHHSQGNSYVRKEFNASVNIKFFL